MRRRRRRRRRRSDSFLRGERGEGGKLRVIERGGGVGREGVGERIEYQWREEGGGRM
jgi:hypothetical protein